MLRIIAGKHRGKKISTNRNLSVRPTMSIVREAIFNILSLKKTIYNSNILDLFCGSGSFSFEALSRGAKHAFMIDSNYHNLQFPKKTAKNLKVDNNITLICCSAYKLPKPITQCDIAFIDPPYNSNLVYTTLKKLANSNWLNKNAIIIIETNNKNKNFHCNGNFNVFLERTYGTTKIVFLSSSTT
ncbi:MAG: 16S rRNA (guanine(966)-N(2))-methyltransferase RsmD [Wolbachia endosymbiont of Menacanthus eurysternus]|nr:MAG: 16S rRNA (guanine(966)-N(2))-methyltransferase RsmD [Wolbachia endosymbiont of Menacanthus eurysternus]